MPEISFSPTSHRPKVGLLPDDYFYAPSAPEVPSVPSPNSGPLKEAQDLVDRVLPNIGDIARVPTNVDIAGCDIGNNIARRAAMLNRTGQGDYDFEDIATEVMDDPVNGFLVVFNNHVQEFARVLYFLADITFTPGTEDHRNYLNSEYTRLQRRLNGEMRGYNAILACAQAQAFVSEHLDAPPFSPIIRPGKVPADFA